MPHSEDIKVQLNALRKYNIQYGPGTNDGGNYEVRSSNQAPGFGYVNPETNNLFPLPKGGSGAPSSFESFTHGRYDQRDVPWTYDRVNYTDHGDPYSPGYQTPLAMGAQMPTGRPSTISSAGWGLGDKSYPGMEAGSTFSPGYYSNPLGQSGRHGRPYQSSKGYFDKSGGFLGYGEPAGLQNEYDELINSLKNVEVP
jgi:hypothetical protein